MHLKRCLVLVLFFISVSCFLFLLHFLWIIQHHQFSILCKKKLLHVSGVKPEGTAELGGLSHFLFSSFAFNFSVYISLFFTLSVLLVLFFRLLLYLSLCLSFYLFFSLILSPIRLIASHAASINPAKERTCLGGNAEKKGSPC